MSWKKTPIMAPKPTPLVLNNFSESEIQLSVIHLKKMNMWNENVF